ncbi:MAG: gliding motility-associated C-terminal domain-containing protein [Bacteroidia bacterium]
MKTRFPFLVLFLVFLLPGIDLFGQYALNGSARQEPNNCFLITPPTGFASGSVWFLNKVNIGVPFDLYFDIFLGCNDAQGADGIAFVLQQVSTNVGSAGGGIGYAGIRPSLAIEFDTWQNGSLNDPFFDHMSIQQNGITNHGSSTLAGPVGILAGNANAEDCQWHRLRITWNPTSRTMNVYVDCVLRLSYTGNIINTIFRNDPNVFWGFTGATGGGVNRQAFCRDFVSFFQEDQEETICKGSQIRLDVGQGDTIRWTPSVGLSDTTIADPIASPDTTTTYTVTIIDECGDTRVAKIKVNVQEFPPADAGKDTVVCGGIPIQLQASGGLTYSWSPSTGLDDPAISNPTVNPSQNTTYTVTVRDSFGCEASDDVLVEIFEADAGPDVFACPGDPVQILARQTALTYSWTPTVGLSSASASQPFVTGSSAMEYILTATHPSGCMDTDTVRFEPLIAPVLSIVPNGTEICLGDSITLEASAIDLTNIRWSPGATLSSTISPRTSAKPSTTTTYTAIVANSDGCRDTGSVTVVVNPPPIIDAGNDTVQCGNVPIQLNATGGISYIWTPTSSLQNPNTSSPLADPATDTDYIVIGTDQNGCRNTDTISVRAFNADAGPDIPVCIGDTTRLAANTSQIAFAWDPAPGLIGRTDVPDPQVFTLTDQDYIVTATDVSGCTDVDTVRVIVNPLPITSVTNPDPYVCSGGPTVLTATGGVNYAWTPSSTIDDTTLSNPTAFPINNGPNIIDSTSYYVTVTDANGCVNYDSIKLEVRLRPVIEVSNDTFVCPGDTVPIWVQGGFGVRRTGWRFDGDFGDTTFLSSTRSEANAFPVASSYYVGEVEAIWGCNNKDSIWVYHIAPNAGTDSTICYGDTIMLQGSGGSTYSWSPAVGLSNPGIANPMAFPQTTTTYSLTVTDSLGCVDTDDITITIRPAPPISIAGDVEICQNDTATLTASGGVSYVWIADDPTITDPTAVSIRVSPSDTSLYVLEGVGQNGCTASDSLWLIVNPLPEVEAGPDIFVCRNEPAFLQGSGAQGYTWTPGIWLDDSLTASPVALPDSNTVFRLTGSDANGCENDDTMRVIVSQLPDAIASPDDSICLYQSIELRVRGNANRYIWSTGSEEKQITVNPRESTLYWVIPYGRNDCPADTIFINLYVEQNLPRAAFSAEITEGFVQLEVPFINESQFASQYVWQFGDDSTSMSDAISFTHVYRREGQFTARLIADNEIGCPDTLEQGFISVWGEELYLPTAFSPNEDGRNDTYFIPNGGFSRMEARIYNRWGRLIYQSNDPGFQWDGRDGQGRSVAEGVYVIQVEAQTFEGVKIVRTGTITLLR